MFVLVTDDVNKESVVIQESADIIAERKEYPVLFPHSDTVYYIEKDRYGDSEGKRFPPKELNKLVKQRNMKG